MAQRALVLVGLVALAFGVAGRTSADPGQPPVADGGALVGREDDAPPEAPMPSVDDTGKATETPATDCCVVKPACDTAVGSSTLRVEEDGFEIQYAPWVFWGAELVMTPDCGAWAFFSAEPADSPNAGQRGRLYAARFDPAAGVWRPAAALPGGEIQFGASAVADADGVVHLVYSDRRSSAATAFSTVVYTRSDGADGWTEPRPVAPFKEAGHQLSPKLALAPDGGLHVIWQDQRSVSAAARAADPSHADIFASVLTDGEWTEPIRLTSREDPQAYGSRPHLVVDGRRLIAVWSIYEESVGLATATRVEWSTRPLDEAEGWTEPRVLVEREDDLIGGRLLDLAAAPTGGAVMIFGRDVDGRVDLILRRLPAAADDWESDVPLVSGDRGHYPALAVGPDGAAYVVYERTNGGDVEVAGVALAPGAAEPGREVVLTANEAGVEGRAAVAVGPSGRPWVVYLHELPGSERSDGVRCLRNARFPD